MTRTRNVYGKIRIEDVIERLRSKFNKINSGIEDEAIKDFERKNKIQLPNDYRTFLKSVDGAEADWLNIYGINEIELNSFSYSDVLTRGRRDMKILLIGKRNADDLAMKLSLSKDEKNKDRRDILDIFHETGDAKVIAHSFTEFLHRYLEKKDYDLEKQFLPYKEYFSFKEPVGSHLDVFF